MTLYTQACLQAMLAAEAAGQALVAYQGTKVNLEGSDVREATAVKTPADEIASGIIKEMLYPTFPGVGFHSEEGGDEEGYIDYQWVIDPLDGTSNFIHELTKPLASVMIALVKGKQPVVGVIHFPWQGRTFTAIKGEGARLIEGSVSNQLQVSQEKHVRGATYYTRFLEMGGVLHRDDQLAKACGVTKQFDASGLEFTLIAMGAVNGVYYLRTVAHDTAAGVIILREAGGRVTDHHGNEWSLESPMIVATNGLIHDQVLNVIDKDSEMIRTYVDEAE